MNVAELIKTLQAAPNTEADVVIDVTGDLTGGATDVAIASVTDETLPATPAPDGPEAEPASPDPGQFVLVSADTTA